MSLTVAGLLAPHLDDGNVDALLAECAGMTKREVEERPVSLRPKPVFMPSIRISPPAPANLPPASPPTSAPASLGKTRDSPPQRPSRSILQPATPNLYNFRFSAGKEFKNKFERFAEVLGVANPLQDMAEILEQALDLALDKKDVKRKLDRRSQREAKAKSRPDEISAGAESRYISSGVRERVHARADYQCEFVGQGGTRCRARTGLEVEHEKPLALYHSHDEKYLRLTAAVTMG
jgi:hypothetical protein